MSAIAAAFLGIVAVGGALYLYFTNAGGPGRQGRFYKGLAWMVMIAGLFFWFQTNPTLAATKVNQVAASAMSTGFQAISSLPTGSSATMTMCTPSGQERADSANTAATACIQDALWMPLVYEPWAIGVVGNSGEAAARYAPALLNAQYVGLDASGNIDEAGQKVLKETDMWNGTKLVGGSGMLGGAAYEHKYVDKVPLVNFYATKVCRSYLGEGSERNDFKSCWSLDGKKSQIRPGDENVANALFGGAFSTRMSAAFMSVGAGVLLNSVVIFVSMNVLWAKLGLWILMIFAPLYLLLGMFPGRSRVAAIKLGELMAGTLFKQVGWGLGLVLLAYLFTTILAAGQGLQTGVAGADWIFKIVTCAFVTLMFAAYGRPLMRAMSGMAVGDKDAGDAIMSVPGDVAKGAGKAAAMVGLAATGAGLGLAGARAAAQGAGTKLGSLGAVKGMANGAMRAVPGHSKWGSAIRGVTDAGEVAQQKESRAIQRGFEKERQEVFENTPHAREGLAVQRENRNQRAAVAAAEAWDRKYGEEAAPEPAPLTPASSTNGAPAALSKATDSRGVVVGRSGGDLLASQFGQAANGQSGDVAQKAMVAAAAADPGSVAALYANPANIDPYHQAAPAIAAYMGSIDNDAVSAADRKAYEQRAVSAISAHGLPDQISGIVSPAAKAPTAMPTDLVENVSALTAPSTPSQMVGGLNALAGYARSTPAGSEVNTAINEFRAQYGSGRMTANQFKVGQARVIEAIKGFQPADTTSIGGDE
ncbi:hypothetical protein GS531_04005 [Rhodococcus hoagii]|nr:hypothetical protein [Prescottella equi]